MKRETERFLVPANGPEVEPMREAILLAARLANEKNTNATLFTPDRDLRGKSIEAALGREVAKKLMSGKTLQLPGGACLDLQSARTFPRHSSNVVLAAYPDKGMLDQIDAAKNAPAVVVVPLTISEVEDWRRSWNPAVLGAPRQPAEVLIANPIVEEAMKALTGRINLGTGLIHPRDKAAAVGLLRELRVAGETFHPDDLRAWAVRHGWTPKDADQLRQVAQATLTGRSLRTRAPAGWKPDIIEILRRRAKNRVRRNNDAK